MLDGSTFVRKIDHPHAMLFSFTKDGENCVVCWTPGPTIELDFPFPVKRIVGRGGQEESLTDNRILIDGSPKYVFCEGDRTKGEKGTGGTSRTDALKQ
jgi:hypothetical protein